MATLYISEYTMLGWTGVQPTQLIQAPAGPPVAEQHLAVGTQVQSAAFNDATKFIRVVSDTDCNLAFGTDPTAVATEHYLPAKAIAFYAVAAGSKISVIANA